MNAKEIGLRLTNAVTTYDRRESTKKHYNRYALAQYFSAIETLVEHVEAGMSTRDAIKRCFCGRLMDVCLRALGEDIATLAEHRRGGPLTRD